MPAIWLFVVTAIPVLLLATIIWQRFRQAKVDRQVDPATPADDPAKGMHSPR